MFCCPKRVLLIDSFQEPFWNIHFVIGFDHSSAHHCDQLTLARNSIVSGYFVRPGNEKFGRWTKCLDG
jgi:hypothetical protein